MKYPKELLETLFKTITEYEFHPELKAIKFHEHIVQEFSQCKDDYQKKNSSSKFKYDFIFDSYTLNSILDFLDGCLTILDFPESLQIDWDMILAVANYNSDFYILLDKNRPTFFYAWKVNNLILDFIEDQKNYIEDQKRRDRGVERAYVYRLNFWKLMDEVINQGNFWLNDS